LHVRVLRASPLVLRNLPAASAPSTVFHTLSTMSQLSARTAFRMTRQAQASGALPRLSQIQRQFSTSPAVRKEIQDAYILSAARTPTAKVFPLHYCPEQSSNITSSMAPSRTYLPPNSAQRPSKPPSRSPTSQSRRSQTYTWGT
jgi:hypothetical protein